MGKASGFLDYKEEENGTLTPERRVQTFDEFHIPLDDDQRRIQAGRCMDCGVPFCQSGMTLAGMVTGCPLHNLIPEWNDCIWQERLGHGWARLSKTNNFPEFTGRVCPALCQAACINGEYGKPVTIHDNERYLADWAFAHHQVTPMIPAIRSGKTVAVVGSGPAGLAVADQLNHRGHTVHVYEREDRIGGLLMYGIPNMKLDKSVVTRRQKLMEEEGVVFHTSTDISTPEAADKLKNDYDAVVLACGTGLARRPAACDPSVSGVYYALDFLRSTTKALLKNGIHTAEDLRQSRGYISAHGKRVVVVGSGDTANDCVATAIRQGCKSVMTIRRSPRPPQERPESNPWPQWPRTERMEYGYEEAEAIFGSDPRVYETTVKEIQTTKSGRLNGIVTVKVRRQGRSFEEVPGSEETVKCEMLLIASGFAGCEKEAPQAFGADLNERGCVKTADGHYATKATGVYCCGDMHRGQSLVVWAIAEGRACAAEVDEYLMGYTV